MNTTPADKPEPEPVAGPESAPQAEPGPEPGAEPAADTEPTRQAEPEPEPGSETGAEPAAETEPGGRRQRRTPLLLGAAAAVLAAFAVLAGLQAHSLRGQTAARNVALTDRPATLALTRQITSAIDTVFSYNYADTAKTSTAAQALLTGQAIRQYDNLFALVRREAPAQHLVLTTTVTNVGAELLTGNRARVLVFANQRDTRGTTHQTSYAGAMFAVNAVRQAGRWRIDTIDTFTGG